MSEGCSLGSVSLGAQDRVRERKGRGPGRTLRGANAAGKAGSGVRKGPGAHAGDRASHKMGPGLLPQPLPCSVSNEDLSFPRSLQVLPDLGLRPSEPHAGGREPTITVRDPDRGTSQATGLSSLSLALGFHRRRPSCRLGRGSVSVGLSICDLIVAKRLARPRST